VLDHTDTEPAAIEAPVIINRAHQVRRLACRQPWPDRLAARRIRTIDAPYRLAGRELPAHPLPDDHEVHPTPCIFCGAMIEHVDDGGIGSLLGAVVDGQSRNYLRCSEGLCAAASAPWIWRCGCVADYVENIGDYCHECRRPRHEAEPYDRVECLICGETRQLDDRQGIANGRCLSCTGGPVYLPVLHEIPNGTPLLALPGGNFGE
jgi:hypothetical protein